LAWYNTEGTKTSFLDFSKVEGELPLSNNIFQLSIEFHVLLKLRNRPISSCFILLKIEEMWRRKLSRIWAFLDIFKFETQARIRNSHCLWLLIKKRAFLCKIFFLFSQNRIFKWIFACLLSILSIKSVKDYFNSRCFNWEAIKEVMFIDKEIDKWMFNKSEKYFFSYLFMYAK